MVPEEGKPYPGMSPSAPVRAALHPCLLLAGVGPSEQTSPLQDERLETSGSSLRSPVLHPAAAMEKTLPLPVLLGAAPGSQVSRAVYPPRHHRATGGWRRQERSDPMELEPVHAS